MSLTNKILLKYFSKQCSDERWAKAYWEKKYGCELNLENPNTFTEKLQWLKLHDRKPIYTQMVDKYLAREIVSKRIGDKHLVPLLGVWDNAKDIDFDRLPDTFVMKCNHNSGEGLCVCTNKAELDLNAVRQKLNKAMSKNYYMHEREWPYKNVPHKIMAEKFMIDNSLSQMGPAFANVKGLIDYKFYCFNGIPRFLQVEFNEIRNGKKHPRLEFRDLEMNLEPFYKNTYPDIGTEIPMPSNFDEMKSIAQKLAEGMPFVRIDLYSIEGCAYFSEFTLYPGAGFSRFSPEEWEIKLGSWLDLSQVNNA